MAKIYGGIGEKPRNQHTSSKSHKGSTYAHARGIESDAPFALPGEVLHVFSAEAGSFVLACAECNGASLVPGGTDECPLCGSDLVADAGTSRRDYSHEAVPAAIAS